jgi:hypothetical protein
MNSPSIAQEVLALLALNPALWQLEEMLAACEHVIENIVEKGGSWRVSPKVRNIVGGQDAGLVRARFVASLEILTIALEVARENEAVH